jgi:hypothetical protein
LFRYVDDFSGSDLFDAVATTPCGRSSQILR